MSKQELNLKAAEYMGYEVHETNCNTVYIVIDKVKIIYDITTHAQQLNDIVEKMRMDVTKVKEVWYSEEYEKHRIASDKSRTLSMIKCIASVLGVNYE